MMQKKPLRIKMTAIRDEINEGARHDMSEKIAETILASAEYRAAKTVFVYVSVKSEVETRRLIERMLSDGKTVAVPKCISSKRIMELYAITDFSQLETGVFNIPEPNTDADEVRKVSAGEVDLAIVPALAFDKNRFRLGYGGGYYDRFLADFVGTSFGVAYPQCLVESLPVEEFDKSVDRLICPEGVI